MRRRKSSAIGWPSIETALNATETGQGALSFELKFDAPYVFRVMQPCSNSRFCDPAEAYLRGAALGNSSFPFDTD